PYEQIIWEAPQKAQQVYFLELLGANVNLGNIPPSEVIPLEAMRNGLRGDTFYMFLNK
ncbi:MAG: phosphosulfolactate synthase, partial [Taibaiella sp.]|nr:phosphosulfolactate synthase [Taibaiella sp.]